MERPMRLVGAALLVGLSTTTHAEAFSSPRDTAGFNATSGAYTRSGAAKGCNLLKGFFGGRRAVGVGCGDEGCSDGCVPEGSESTEAGRLIARARTACRAGDRAEAVDDLGEIDCDCRPEILATLIHALSDVDADVRAEAVDSIGEMLEDGRCGRSPEVIAALSCALGDCDEDVREEAEEALEVCGIDVRGGDVCRNFIAGDVDSARGPTVPAPAPLAPGADGAGRLPTPVAGSSDRSHSLTRLFGLGE